MRIRKIFCNILTSNLRVTINIGIRNEIFFKKQSKEKVSEAVMRAVSRLNKYEEQKGSRSIVWNGKIN